MVMMTLYARQQKRHIKEETFGLYGRRRGWDVSMLVSQIIPSSPCPIESKSLFIISVSLLLSRI